MNTIIYQNWNSIEYGKAWQKQEAILNEALETKSRIFRKEIEASEQKIQNYLIVCRHPHVYTLGKSGAIEHLLLNNENLEKRGVQFYKTNRGGDITYHGPGQLVSYPILNLEDFRTDLGWYMRSLEQVIINTIGTFGIQGERLDGSTGVWLDVDKPANVRKICAMGVRCSRWMTMHGLALNINSDMDFFNYIVPCGIVDKGVTSMGIELGREVDEAEVEEVYLKEFSKVFQVDVE